MENTTRSASGIQGKEVPPELYGSQAADHLAELSENIKNGHVIGPQRIKAGAWVKFKHMVGGKVVEDLGRVIRRGGHNSSVKDMRGNRWFIPNVSIDVIFLSKEGGSQWHRKANR